MWTRKTLRKSVWPQNVYDKIIYSVELSKIDAIFQLLLQAGVSCLRVRNIIAQKFGHFQTGRNEDGRATIEDFDLPLTYINNRLHLAGKYIKNMSNLAPK